MESKPTILKFLSKIFTIYGVTMLILNIFALVFGAEAKGFSTIFEYGNCALSIKTSLQFLLATFILVFVETVFMTDIFIKKMKTATRIILMFVSIFAVVTAFVAIFGWFPMDMALPWIMFIICFGICSTVSTVISIISEKQENQKLEEALKKFKGEQ